jgi:hypothetical protein
MREPITVGELLAYIRAMNVPDDTVIMLGEPGSLPYNSEKDGPPKKYHSASAASYSKGAVMVNESGVVNMPAFFIWNCQ